MGAREFVYLVTESSFGTPKATPVLGTDACYMRLDQAGSFKAEASPIQSSIPYGGGYNVEADTVSDTVETKGTFNFLLFPGIYSALLLKWAMIPVNVGRTAPWVTTDAAGVMPVSDLASLSFYHGYMLEDGATYRRQRYAGAKCDEWSLAAAEGGQGRLWRLSGSFTAQKVVGNPWDSSTDPDATELPLPADSSYPTGPYTFGHLGSGSGTITIGSSAGTNRAASCSSIRIRGQNKFGLNYYSSRFPVTNRFNGRACSLEAGLRFKGTPDDRASWRNLTPQTVSFKIDNGSSSVALDFKANNLIRPWNLDLPPEGEYMQTLGLASRYSATAGTDLALTVV